MRKIKCPKISRGYFNISSFAIAVIGVRNTIWLYLNEKKIESSFFLNE